MAAGERRRDLEGLDGVSDVELWAARCEQRADLVAFVKERSGLDRLAERQPRPMIEAASRVFDPDVLTVGFARRNATYKRLGLLVQDPGRAIGCSRGLSRFSSCWLARRIQVMRRPSASSRICIG